MILTIYGLAAILTYTSALTCYRCNTTGDPADCRATEICQPGETCFTTLASNGVRISFEQGCKSTQNCMHTKRSSVPLMMQSTTQSSSSCHECCSEDLCNEFLCFQPNKADSSWSIWSQWGDCSGTCGQGQRTRQRSCSYVDDVTGNSTCVGQSIESKACNLQPCHVDGAWGQWQPWGVCSVTCDVGLKTRYRNCDSPPPQNGGHICAGKTEEQQICFPRACADGGWSVWSSWTQCTVTCNGGEQRRLRQCNSPNPSTFGRPCSGTDTELKLCNNNPCAASAPSPIPTSSKDVAFLVNGLSTTSPGPDTTLIFTNELTNTDNVYNTTTGMFTAPVRGTYIFSARLCSAKSQTVNFRIYVNNNVLSDATNYDKDSYSTCTSVTTLAILQPGDQVCAKTGPNTFQGYTIIQERFRWDMFMGTIVN